MIYYFLLGNAIGLSRAELESLLVLNKINYKILHEFKSHLILDAECEIKCSDLIKQSGGIIKIGKIISKITSQGSVTTDINELKIDNIAIKQYSNFGVSLVGFQANVKDICEKLKHSVNLHYILPKEGHELSSAQISNKNILEIVIVKVENEFIFFQTQCVQDINYWSKKDVGRPFVDDRLGMLPLKVARMMINISLAVIPRLPAFGGKTGILNLSLLDPFCGMGSILEEAIDVGFKNVIGSDINKEVLTKCEKNLKWFIDFSGKNVNLKVINSDAAKISEKLDEKIDLIVTEPFLGDARKLKRINELTNLRFKDQAPKNMALEIKNIVKGLEKMYLGALKDWQKVLKKESVICLVVPEIEVEKHVFKIPFVEICGKLGYNIIGCYEYSREKAIVKRKIYVIKYQIPNSK